MMPIIDVYAIAWNEEYLMPYFLRHYDYARKITVLDNESSDNTVAIAASNQKVEVVSWSSQGQQDNMAMLYQKNNCWRGSDADYVVVCDIDEFVDCRKLDGFGAKDVAFRCEGRMMHGVDGQPLESIRRYALYEPYNKIAVFSPRIAGINYAPGAHVANPQCSVLNVPRLILRHYHSLGEEYVVRRYRRYAERMSQSDRAHGFGCHYLEPEDRIREIYRSGLSWKLTDDQL